SDATKQAVQKLLELKKQYKETTGQEYKPGQAPEACASAPAPVTAVNGDSSAAGLFKEIEAQGEIVRSEKAKDPKSEASKAAIAKLLDLKKQYKEKTGQEYKPGQAPAAPAPAANGASSDASSLYSQIEAQGELVRKEKAKDAKSEAAKAAIAKLLELKKQYKEATGQEYKPGQAAVAPPASTPAAPAVSGSVDASALYAEIEAQGDLVRKEKAKDAKSEAAKSAIAKLLELKKAFKEKTGQDYKPGQPPTANATVAAPSVAGDASALYNEIQAQGELVRKEKAKDAKSEASKAAIAKLLELKKQYKEKTGQEYKPKDKLCCMYEVVGASQLRISYNKHRIPAKILHPEEYIVLNNGQVIVNMSSLQLA
ncbi:WHEP-TRS domain protein, partial [Ancylostoma duodenale]